MSYSDADVTTGRSWYDNDFVNGSVTYVDVRILARERRLYKIGDALDKYYLPVMASIGVVGNILSFLIMMQKQNRQMSFSLYISALAFSDTFALFLGCLYFLLFQHLDERPNQFLYCDLWLAMGWVLSLCSALLIVTMTFERFYSIVQPHKAASFNTVKRAKIAIVCIFVFSTVFTIPHLYTTLQVGKDCIPLGRGFSTLPFKFYSWMSISLNFCSPFILLLIMNSVIIHTLRTRLNFRVIKDSQGQDQGQGQGQGQSEGQSNKSNEKQIYVTLLLVTFVFLGLSTPMYALFFYNALAPNQQYTPESFARFYLLTYAARQAYFTNYGINFFLYVISGRKFRSDLMNLLKCNRKKNHDRSGSNLSGNKTISSFIQEE